MGLLGDRGAWLNAQMQEAAATANAITYRRAADAAEVDLTGLAWVDRTVFVSRAPTTVGPSVIFGDRDYMVPAADLVSDAETFEPAEGDWITEEVNGYRVTFEVQKTAGEPSWRWADPERTCYRLHTKEVRREAV